MPKWLHSIALSLGLISAPLISPLATNPLSAPNTNNAPKEIIGFVPFWLPSATNSKIVDTLTQISYFSFTIDGKGKIIKRDTENYQDHLGWHNWQRRFKNILSEVSTPTSISLTIKSDDALTELLSNPSHHQNLADELTLYQDTFTEFIIDFEPTTPLPDYQLRLTDLVKHLHEKNIQMSIAVYASAQSKPNIWDLENLHPYLHHIIVMTYDYHQASSPRPGPVAPLIDDAEKSITDHIPQIARAVPLQKIILGIPLYGYSWITNGYDSKANAYPDSGRFISLKNIEDVLNSESIVSTGYIGLSPYLAYDTENNSIIQIHYENMYSISEKIKYANDAGLGGIALWAVGYEPDVKWVNEALQNLNN